MIDPKDIKIGDEIIVSGIVGYNRGFVYLTNHRLKSINNSIILENMDLFLDEQNGIEYIVGFNTIQEVIKKPEYKVKFDDKFVQERAETFPEFGDVKFIMSAVVTSFFKDNKISDLDKELFHSIKYNLNYRGHNYILLYEFEEFFNNWKCEEISIGDKVKNKNPGEIGIITHFNQDEGTFDVMVNIGSYSMKQQIQDWDILE